MELKPLHFISFWFVWSKVAFVSRGHPRQMEDFNSNHTAKALQKLLKIFGLERNFFYESQHPVPPQYMLDLYRSFSAEVHFSDSQRFHHGANTIRSFFSKDSHGKSGGVYQFDLSGIPTHELVVEGQFHFFINPSGLRYHQSPHLIQIRLYDGLANFSSGLLEARLVSAHVSGWEVFTVTPCIKRWIADMGLNKGLSIQVLYARDGVWEERPQNRQSSRQPILVVFSQDMRTVSYPKPLSGKQSSVYQHITKDQNLIDKSTLYESNTRETRSAITAKKGDCGRHELRVDFEKLGWSSWIISPKWYDAYICTGACSFPIGQNQRPTNHATVQSIVHELGLANSVDAPCCVPTELQPVSLLYFDEYMNVVLKQYEDMIATACGCQ